VPKTRSSSGRRRMSRWPVALVLGLAAGTPALSALVAGCSSGGDDSNGSKSPTTSTESISSSGMWPASDQTTEAIGVVTWRAAEQSDGSFKLDGLDTDGNTAWTIDYVPTADGVNFVSPGGEMDIDSTGITQNTLDPASKYGLAALSYDLQASGFSLPTQGDLELTSVRDLITGSDGGDGGLIHDAGPLVDASDAALVHDAGPLVKDAGSLVSCGFKSLLNALAGTLGTFLNQCANASVTFADGGISTSFQNKCNNLGSTFTNSFTSGLKACTGSDAGTGTKTTSTDGGKTTTSPTSTGNPTSGVSLVNLDAAAGLITPIDAGAKLTSTASDASGGTTITITINFNPPDAGTTTTDSGTTTTDAGTTTTTDAAAATTTVDAGVTAAIPVPYPATGFVVIDDAINTDSLGVGCTATMISRQVAVTTASCLWVKNASGGYDPPWSRHRFAFGAGVVDDATRNTSREAVQVIANPNFDPTLATAANSAVDIGYLFLLPAPAGSTIAVAGIAPSAPVVGEQAQGSGYGLTSATQVTSGVANANFRKTFPFDVQSVSGATFHAQVDQSLALCAGDQGSGAYADSNGQLLGILTGSSVSTCAPGAGGTYLSLSGFSAFQTCAIASVRSQTASYNKASSCSN
jgi:hypothetical protein